jgi:hypothetical protein
MADQKPEPAPDLVLAGIDRIRDTAKWLIGAYAAVGAVLVAGLQLTSLGKVEDDTRLWVAIGTAAIALLAVLYGISKIAAVLSPVTVDEEKDLGPGSPIEKMTQKAPSLLKKQARTPAELQAKYATAVDDYQRKRVAARADPELVPEVERDYRALLAINSTLDYLKKLALFQKVDAKFSGAKRRLAGASIVAAACVITFAWAANPSDDDQARAKAHENGPTLLDPSLASVSVDPRRAALKPLRTKLGSGCDIGHIAALVVGGSAQEPEVVTLPEHGCSAIRFSVGDDVGIAVAAQQAPSP